MTTEPDPSAEILDDLAAYALDALDDGERLAVEATLLADERSARRLAALQRAAAQYGAADVAARELEEPAPELRARVLDAAFARRAPISVTPAGVVDAHAIETERFELLVRRLTDEQMDLPLDPPEFAGWTIRELLAHLTSNEALLAQVVGAPIEVPERDNSNEPRTAEVIERHRSLTTAEATDEHRRARLAVDGAVRGLDAAALDDEVTWWGAPMRLRDALVLRAFETWTHGDDIRRAVGLPPAPPSAPILQRMSSEVVNWMPLSMSTTGHDYRGRSLVLDLTGPGGGRYHVDLTFDDRDLTGVEPDAVVHMDVVAFCHGVGKRRYLYPDGLPFEAEGTRELAIDLIDTIDALAVL